jgi:hypothetical protein
MPDYLLLLLTSTRILAPLGKEQVINLLVNAGCLYPAIADNIINVARKKPFSSETVCAWTSLGNFFINSA